MIGLEKNLNQNIIIESQSRLLTLALIYEHN